MTQFVCIFEDKKFSNFFPLSLSQPVFALRIGARNLSARLQTDSGAERFGVLCREYLGSLVAAKEPDIAVNELPGGDTVFLIGRLLCYGDELAELLDKIPDGGIAVKGGYVVAAKLPGGAIALGDTDPGILATTFAGVSQRIRSRSSARSSAAT